MNQFSTPPEQEESIDFKEIFFKLVSFWPYILGSTAICLSIALITNRYARNIYEISTVLNVEEAQNPLASSNVSLAFNWGGADALESKLALINSYTIHERVA